MKRFYLTLRNPLLFSFMFQFDRLLTKPKVHLGQTLYISSKPGPIAAQISARAWYNQIIFYDFQTPRITDMNSYFVQMIWRSATDVGVGKYQSASGKTYVVAFYNPLGNTDDGLNFNVLPITSKFCYSIKACLRNGIFVMTN